MKNTFNLGTRFFVLALVIILGSCEPNDEDIMAADISETNLTVIDRDAMVGEWQLTTMQADSLVDLNDDGIGHENILEETTCFDSMGITFYDDGTFTTVNSKLDFNYGPNGDEFKCLSGRTDHGTWDIENDELILNLEINAEVYTDRKIINKEADKFGFDVSKFESSQYVDDPGDSHASHILVLAVEYTRVN
ncbi:MAG TPA: DUF5004 domain-containing protein [Salegentibacter sp.]|uniref:DUF5004 domain-containing protein n=1 Tax=Salegentibacter sp. TaxID=1903072 RepID=UPI002F9392F4